MAAAAANTLNPEAARYSTYSGAPSIHPSIAPTMESRGSQQIDGARNKNAAAASQDKMSIARSASTTSTTVDARSAEIKEWAATIERLVDSRLEQQRFVPSGEKSDELSTNALGAKLERALGRRMSAQDAQHSSKQIDEKAVEPVAA